MLSQCLQALTVALLHAQKAHPVLTGGRMPEAASNDGERWGKRCAHTGMPPN